MNIKLFSLCKQDAVQTENGKKRILKCVKGFFPDCGDFANFTSQKRMLLAAAQSLSAADVVIIAVQNNMYNATKRLLAQALEFRLMKNNAVYNVLKPLAEAGQIKETTLNSNSAFPQGALLLPTETMFNCGFVLTSGSQHIIYVPVEAPFSDEVVFGSLYDFLAGICDPTSAKIGLDARHRAIVKRTANKLDEDCIKVAFSVSDASSLVENLSADMPSKHCFVFDPAKEFNDSTPSDIISLARTLRESQFASFGVVFSDVMFDDEGKRILKVAIADESGTNTLTFFGIEDESDKDFIANCVDKTMLMLYNHEDLGSGKVSKEAATVADKSLRKTLVLLSAGMIGASAVVGLILSLLG